MTSDRLEVWKCLLPSEVIKAAETASSKIVDPKTASADDCWGVVWDKPLYANTRISSGDRMSVALRPYMDGAWKNWGLPCHKVAIAFEGRTNKRCNFSLVGQDAPDVDRLGIARHRLFAVQGGANLLRTLDLKAGHQPPFKNVVTRPLGEVVHFIRETAGRGWGHITILHLLTDFGLAVKPDLHLVRTVRKLKLLPDLPERNVPTLLEALQINAAVDSLAKTCLAFATGHAKGGIWT